MKQWKFDSQLGPLFLVASPTGLRGVFWKEQKVPMASSLSEAGLEQKILQQAVSQIESYLDGKLLAFDLPLEPEGSDFQQRVWKQLQKIPYGKTCSYSEVARRLQKEKAVRAVGTANGRNPLCLIIPCHRVIAADGSLGGYSGGLERKQKLLQLEKTRT